MIRIEQSTDAERAMIRQYDGDLSYNLKDENGTVTAAFNAKILGDVLEIEDMMFENVADGALVFDVILHYAMERGLTLMTAGTCDEEKTEFLKMHEFEEAYREGRYCFLKRKLLSVHEYVREYVLKLENH